MSETATVPEQRSSSRLLVVLLVVAVVAALAGLVWSYFLTSRLTNAEARVASAQAQNQKLASALDETNARLRVTSETLGRSLGLTQQQLEQRAQDLLRRQQVQAQHFETEHTAEQQQIGAVSTDVTGVKTDVGGVKTDLNATKTQLQATESQLQSMKGDLGIQSGLIATNAQELEILKHVGDRTYYEFTLDKRHKKAVATVALELKKADPKHSRFTLVVDSDDKQILKKDRSLDEPIQFYSGKNHLLYELVVNSIPNKNTIQGYIAAPKNAPIPVTPTAE
jgi:hypothetical protein